ncbi:uncharacterized protein Z518_03470 [Rhinocladiella mackenziei CBS 650.93]|uniref:Rhinocladiella mackenziei CBS 650.93 unplaced genomic scaffold supercont1.2, whole genome shotgun sequence n=1 Tax=Rhinocladiella mackenziei CBS 650.93 TaxID=1442369 RepID=A0A0D2HE19_9EURO|nr:uncharacterized protein Z518_03470 [Rhinocladiella mackenziei CBS 650.93]KIX08813.1 hypothetical protein Z518_03470 [Rhinocladiella mackenziei CBS 650.93]
MPLAPSEENETPLNPKHDNEKDSTSTLPPAAHLNDVDKDATLSVSEGTGGGKGDPENKEDKKKEGAGFGPYLRVWRYAKPIDHMLRICGFFAACGAGAALPLMTIVFGDMIDDFNNFGTGQISMDEIYDDISNNALYFLYLFIGKFFLVFINTTCFRITAIRATKALRQDFIVALVRQDIAYFDNCSPGTVATTISNNADIVENGLGEKVGVAFQALAMLAAAFIVAFTQQWKLTLVTATTLPLAVIVVGITVAIDAKLEAKILKIYGTAGGLAEEAMSTVRIVTAFNATGKLRRKYDEYLETAKRYGVKKGPVLGFQYSTEFFAMYCAYALAWFYGIKLLVQGDVGSGGDIITVLFSVLIGTSSITMIAPSIGEISKAAAAAQGMFEMIDRQTKIDPMSEEGKRPENPTGTISLRNVTFSYPSRPTVRVLDDLSVDFEAGKITAIVGASGSGKSTIVGLITRWFDPDSGSILFDGIDIKDLNVRWLRRNMGFVQQEPTLFSDTIYNNISHGIFGTDMDDRPESEKRELVRQACVQAYADQFVEELPEKYDTKVGDKGGFLSGGQKQRVAIARSVIANPRILLLDEATSALDPTAEGIVQAALDNVSQTRTTIMIAHKLSTVQKADKIVVLSKGKLVEQGTHQDLLARKGAYYGLVSAQNLDSRQDSSSKPVDEKSGELQLRKTQTPVHASSGQPELVAEDVSRKFSLARCIVIVLYEQRRLWPFFLGGFLASVGGGGVFPAQAIVFSESVKVFRLPLSRMENRGNFWALMYFIMGLGVLLCYASLGLLFTVAAFYATRFYRSEYFAAILKQDVPFFDLNEHSAGAMTSRLSTDPQRLQDLISSNFGLILIVIVNLIGSCTLALAYDWQLALVAIFGCIPPLFAAGFTRMRLEMSSQDRMRMMYHESARFASEAIGAIRTVSSLTLEPKVVKTYDDKLTTTSAKDLRHTVITMILFGLSESLDLGAMGLAFWYGGKLLSEGKVDVDVFFVVFIAIIFGGQAAGFLFGFTLNTTKAHSAANHIIDLCRSQPIINTSTGLQTIPKTDDSDVAIEFKDVWFSYPTRPDVKVLQGLRLQIRKGESIGIVGASGCGKTTVISLLERFYDIQSGDILINGTSLKDFDVHFHRSRIGMVSQDTTLYQGSIRDNVLIGFPQDTAPEERLIKACKDANIHDFIQSLPDGYDTDAGTRGLSLSGGQRQRIAIARALIRDPEILLFDEATSALDTENEIIVQEAIEAAAKGPGRTTISVAHRLSTIKRCDRIYVLHHGRVVEVGAHHELIARGGRYYQMVLAQSLDRQV